MWMSSKSDCPMSAPSPTFFWCLGSSMQYWRCCPRTQTRHQGLSNCMGLSNQPTIDTLCGNTLHSGALMTLVFKPFNSIKSKSDFCPIAVGDLAIGKYERPGCFGASTYRSDPWPIATWDFGWDPRQGEVLFHMPNIPMDCVDFCWHLSPIFPCIHMTYLSQVEKPAAGLTPTLHHDMCTTQGNNMKGGGKQREAKQPNALRRSSVPPSAPRVWRMLPHPRPDQRQQMIAPFQAANASWRPFAKWEPNQALFLEPASHSFSARLFVITPFWWCRIPTSDSLRFTCFISYMTCAYICHKLGYSTLE